MKLPVAKERIRFYLVVSLAFLVCILFYELNNYPNNIAARIVNIIWRIIPIIIINYIYFEITLPLVRKTRRNLALFLLLFISALCVQFLLYSFGGYAWRLAGIWVGIYTSLRTYPSLEEALQAIFFFGFCSLLFFGIVKFVYDYIKFRHINQESRLGKQQAELNYLKSQTNPHFLFNTLNNIYSLSRFKPDMAPDSIMRLSKILRFMLYETNVKFIPLEKEVKIISDYIDLEKLRYDESLSINFSYDIDDMKQALPPLLLIPLVENAFKHGASETREHPYVDIQLTSRQQQLHFLVKNSTGPNLSEDIIKENIGLSNLRRQLELLYKDYNLSVKREQSAFTVNLKINLKSHV